MIELWSTISMKAYSQDLRQRVLRAVDQGTSQAVIAEAFAVSVATIKRSLKQRRESGHVLPRPLPGRPAKKGDALREQLVPQLQTHPDALCVNRFRAHATEANWKTTRGRR